MAPPHDETTGGTLAVHAPIPDPNVGRLLAGRYELHERIASGGMGAIYKAMQRGMGRWVAVKLLLEHLSADDEVARRFYREMQATARIEHPNTVRIYDFGHSETGDLFLVMELLDGRTLEEVMVDDGPLPPARAARIGAQVAAALAAAHCEGVIHRDLKPENILLCDDHGHEDRVKVLDFGLARLVDAHPGERTAVGLRVGTPAYMSPETVKRQEVDARSDLYALGVLLFEMVVGRPPFVGAPSKVMAQHESASPPRAAEAATGRCPAWLDSLVDHLLRKEPDARPKDAVTVARLLEQGVIREAAIEAGHLDEVTPPPAPAQAAPVAGLVVALVLGALLGGTVTAAAATVLWLLLGA